MLRLSAIFALVLLVSACTQRLEVMRADINNLKSDTYKTQRETSELKASIGALSKEIETLRAELEKASKEETAEALREAQANLLLQIQELLNEVRTLKGALEEETHLRKAEDKKSSEIAEQIAQRQKALEDALKTMESRLALMEETIKKLSAPPTKEQAQVSPEKAYDEAYSDFTEKRYAEAREKFSRFLKTYPEHKLAGNAQYWLGETYYFEKDYENAILAYEEVIKKYKDSPKVPAAMLKQAFAFIEIGDSKAASVILKELLSKYPESEQSAPARKKLEEIAPQKDEKLKRR